MVKRTHVIIDDGVKIRQRRDGRFYFSYKVGSVRREISSGDYDKLLTRARKIQQHQTIAGAEHDPEVLFIDYLNDYNHTFHFKRIRQSTIRRYEADMKNITADAVMASIKLIDLTDVILQDFYNRLAQQKSASTVKQAHKLIAPALRHAAACGLVRRNPGELVIIPTDTPETQLKKAERAEAKPLSREEHTKLLKYCLNHFNQYRATDLLIALLVETGMRVSEAIALTWADIGSDNMLRVCKQWNSDTKEIFVPKTSAGVRRVPLPQHIINALTRLKPMQAARMEIMRKRQTPETPIFSSDIGTHKDRQNVNKTLKRICKKIGIPARSCHDLRHTFATDCFDAGISPQVVQKWLGDSDIKTVMNVYVHWRASARQDAAQKKFAYDLKFYDLEGGKPDFTAFVAKK